MPVSVKCSLSLWFLSQIEDTNLTIAASSFSAGKGDWKAKLRTENNSLRAENKLWPF